MRDGVVEEISTEGQCEVAAGRVTDNKNILWKEACGADEVFVRSKPIEKGARERVLGYEWCRRAQPVIYCKGA